MLAGIRADAAYHAAQAGLIAALHALILTALARLIARLDHIVTLWAAGQLPIPAPAKPRTERTARPGTPARHTPRTRRPRQPMPAPVRLTARAIAPRPAPPIFLRTTPDSVPRRSPSRPRPPPFFFRASSPLRQTASYLLR